MQSGATTLVSAASGGAQGNWPSVAPSISPDGRYVAFESNATNLISPPASGDYSQIYVHDRQTGANWLAGKGPGGIEGNGNSNFAHVSGDGRYVAFYSRPPTWSARLPAATNLCVRQAVRRRHAGQR